MVIYKEYDTSNLLFNEPCTVEGIGNIHPILVKDNKKLYKYASYLIFSKKHLNIEDDTKLLEYLIMSNVATKCGLNRSDDNVQKCLNEVLQEIIDLISMITKTEIKADIIGGMYVFSNADNSVFINPYNYNTFREIVLKQNLLREPKIFEDKLYEEMYYKSMRANRKEGASFEDRVLTIIQDMKYAFEYVLNLNIFQLNSLYLRIAHVKNSDAITIYRTCSSKLPDVNYADGVIESLFKESDDSDLFANLDGIADKL